MLEPSFAMPTHTPLSPLEEKPSRSSGQETRTFRQICHSFHVNPPQRPLEHHQYRAPASTDYGEAAEFDVNSDTFGSQVAFQKGLAEQYCAALLAEEWARTSSKICQDVANRILAHRDHWEDQGFVNSIDMGGSGQDESSGNPSEGTSNDDQVSAKSVSSWSPMALPPAQQRQHVNLASQAMVTRCFEELSTQILDSSSRVIHYLRSCFFIWWCIKMFLLIFLTMHFLRYFIGMAVIALLRMIPMVGSSLAYIVQNVGRYALNCLEASFASAVSAQGAWSFFTEYYSDFTSYFKWTATPITIRDIVTELQPDGTPFSSSLATTINDTMRLATLGLSMLPLASTLHYSSLSLLNAGAIVRGSNIYQKEDLTIGYDELMKSTTELGRTLSSFDITVESLIEGACLFLSVMLKSIDRHLKYLVLNKHTLVSTIQSLSIVAPTFCFDGPVAHGSDWYCLLPLLVTIESECFFMDRIDPKFNAFWCFPVRFLRLSYRSDAEIEQLNQKSREIRGEILSYYSMFDFHMKELVSLAETGIDQTEKVAKNYARVLHLRLQNENAVKNKINSISVNAEVTPGLLQYLAGQRKGLSRRDLHHLVSSNGQIRNLNEIASTHNDAYVAFIRSIELLSGMRTNLKRMYSTLDRIRDLGSNNGEWNDLISELEKMRPMVGGLKSLGNFHNDVRKRHTRFWMDKANFCQVVRRDDWEVCVLEETEVIKAEKRTEEKESTRA